MQEMPSDKQVTGKESTIPMRKVFVTLRGMLFCSAFRSFELEVSEDADLATMAPETLNELADFEQIPWDFGECDYVELQDYSIDECRSNGPDNRKPS
ncbi:MAG: hypothetical protein RIS70_2220 [Planctomycetota bacterium]|jgi:hypothetical protein